MEITKLCWNPAYKDLFAASYGSCELILVAFFLCLSPDNWIFFPLRCSDNFYDQDGVTNGVVCVFSLKNPSYPEFLCTAQCGIISVDVHPDHPHMLAAGLADGNVAVYNLQEKSQKPKYISTARNGKHQDIVWQVPS